jgi:SAM-dependent methyltransferase
MPPRERPERAARKRAKRWCFGPHLPKLGAAAGPTGGAHTANCGLPDMPDATVDTFSPRDWVQYYTRKRIVHQWTQVDLLNAVECRRVLEIGPALGLVTALLANAGYDVTTLDNQPRAFTRPNVPHIQQDLLTLTAEAIAGFDAILCCETLEHLEWSRVGPALSALRASGARYLVVSVPYSAFQFTFDLYANRHTLRQYFSLKLGRHSTPFRPAPPGGHQWEVGYRGFALPQWEQALRSAGWSILARRFTEHTRSVFHLLGAT